MGNTTGIISLAIGCALALGIYLRDGGAWNAFVTEWFGIYITCSSWSNGQ
ncbi:MULTISPECIES: hypothetical protein [Prevotella]|nr:MULTISPECIES: hypothetical protein [Prevotella]